MMLSGWLHRDRAVELGTDPAVERMRTVAMQARRLMAMLAVASAAWACHEAEVVIRADWSSCVARLQVQAWQAGREPWSLADWERARVDLQGALALTPKDAVLLEGLAGLYALRGQAEWGDGSDDSPGVAHYRTALSYQQQAVALRPDYPSSWASLALMHYAVNSPSDVTFTAWRRALRLGPNEAEVKATLMAVAKLTWAVSPLDVRDWVESQEPGAAARLDAAVDSPSR